MMDWRIFKESIIFASHDQTLANHIIVLKNGVIDRIDETHDEFLKWRSS